MIDEPSTAVLLYFVLPIWLVAGFADWLCHRRARIEATAGVKESLLHLLMFAEVGVPLLAIVTLHWGSSWRCSGSARRWPASTLRGNRRPCRGPM